MVWFFALLFLDALVNLFAVNGDFLRRVDANPHLITFNTQYGDSDFVTHHQGLSDPASQNQHSFLLTDSISDNKSANVKRRPDATATGQHPSIDQHGRKESSTNTNQNNKRRG